MQGKKERKKEKNEVHNRKKTPEEQMVQFRDPLGKPDFETNY